MNLVISWYPRLSCLRFIHNKRYEGQILACYVELFFSNCTAISDIGGNVHHPRDCLIAIDEAVVTLPLMGKCMK